MNWKTLLPLVTLAAALAGCGGDDCTRAADQMAVCMPATSGSTGGMMMAEACAGAALCRAQCTNQFTCAQITGNTPAYTNCLALCLGK
jgi:hypothetical protein